jgi:hypothetical protein
LPKSRKHLQRRGKRRKRKTPPKPTIGKFFEQTISRSNRPSPHQVLYHYTDVEGALGILRSQQFWSTAHDCTNDDEELISATPTVITVAEECRSHAKGPSQTVLDFFLERYPNSMISQIRTVYLTCFSTKRDDPSQWKEYGHDGSGICLGIRVIEEDAPTFPDRASVMLEVDYSEASLHKWLKEIFEKFCSVLASARETKSNYLEGLSAFYRVAAYASIKAKREKWEDEHEVRLATLASGERPLVDRERMGQDGKVIRYLPVSVRAADKLIALDEIIIGSNQDTDRAQQEVETVLAVKGYTPGSVEYPRITVAGNSLIDGTNPRSLS